MNATMSVAITVQDVENNIMRKSLIQLEKNIKILEKVMVAKDQLIEMKNRQIEKLKERNKKLEAKISVNSYNSMYSTWADKAYIKDLILRYAELKEELDKCKGGQLTQENAIPNKRNNNN